MVTRSNHKMATEWFVAKITELTCDYRNMWYGAVCVILCVMSDTCTRMHLQDGCHEKKVKGVYYSTYSITINKSDDVGPLLKLIPYASE